MQQQFSLLFRFSASQLRSSFFALLDPSLFQLQHRSAHTSWRSDITSSSEGFSQPSVSLRQSTHHSASSSGPSVAGSPGAPVHLDASDSFSMGPSVRASPRTRRHLVRASNGGSPTSPPASGQGIDAGSSSGSCALCCEVLDMNRALYKTHCGVLCHVQCARAERNQLRLSCRLCGQSDPWMASSPHAQA